LARLAAAFFSVRILPSATAAAFFSSVDFADFNAVIGLYTSGLSYHYRL
jgi:hypothetical protein